MSQHYVFDDPTGKHPEGKILDEVRARGLRAKKVTMLPLRDLSRAPRSAVSLVFSRHCPDGLALAYPAAGFVGPVVLHANDECREVHWAVRLVPTKMLEGQALNGQLRLTGDSGQVGSLHGSVAESSVVDLSKLGEPDERGGWTVSGRAAVRVPRDGIYGFSLYGFGVGAKIVALTATVT